jgi:hypothetical protein
MKPLVERYLGTVHHRKGLEDIGVRPAGGVIPKKVEKG